MECLPYPAGDLAVLLTQENWRVFALRGFVRKPQGNPLKSDRRAREKVSLGSPPMLGYLPTTA
jgi:hypothetical protein